MDYDLITLNEVGNDGKTIHLYFNSGIGLYVAYGFSAFFVTHIVNVVSSFSEDLQMPVSLLRRSDVDELRKSTVKHRHDHHQYYRLGMKQTLALDGYTRWANSVKWE